jgi:hypothetical protein
MLARNGEQRTLKSQDQDARHCRIWYFPQRNQCVGTEGYSVLRLRQGRHCSGMCLRAAILLVPARPFLTTHGPHVCDVKDFGIYVRNNRFMLTGRSYQGDLAGKIRLGGLLVDALAKALSPLSRVRI